MTTWLVIGTVLAIAAVLALAWASHSGHTETRRQIKTIDVKVEDTRAEMREGFTATNEKIDDMSARVDSTNQKIDDMGARVDSTNEKIDGLSEKLDGLIPSQTEAGGRSGASASGASLHRAARGANVK